MKKIKENQKNCDLFLLIKSECLDNFPSDVSKQADKIKTCLKFLHQIWFFFSCKKNLFKCAVSTYARKIFEKDLLVKEFYTILISHSISTLLMYSSWAFIM